MKRKRRAKPGTTIKAKPIGRAVGVQYRKGSGKSTYAHAFGPMVRIGVVGRYLVIGPITLRGGDIHG